MSIRVPEKMQFKEAADFQNSLARKDGQFLHLEPLSKVLREEEKEIAPEFIERIPACFKAAVEHSRREKAARNCRAGGSVAIDSKFSSFGDDASPRNPISS